MQAKFKSLQSISFSQDIQQVNPVNETGENNYDSKYLLQQDLNSTKNSATKQSDAEKIQSIELYRYSFDLMHTSKKMKEESTFNIVSSFRRQRTNGTIPEFCFTLHFIAYKILYMTLVLTK